MMKAICVLLLVGVSCGKPTEAEQPTKANTPGNTGSETNMSAPESTPIANDEIRVSCKQDTDCIVIKSYCGGWASVHTSSVDVARKRYDATGAIKNCRQGTVPAPDAYCESETCAPAHVWNTGYAVSFGDYIDFNPPRGKTHFKAETLVPIRISHNDKEEALIALRETLEQKHPGILEKSTNYQVQYMGATTPGNANGDVPSLVNFR